jgi:hypothetical protein
MFKNCGSKVLAGTVALALAGTAVANTSIDAAATGDLFLNIVDVTNSTSFLYDTGLSQAAFNGNGSYSYNVAVEPSLKGFLNSTDTFNYSIISATKTAGAATIDFTGGADTNNPTPVTPDPFSLNQTQAPISQFLTYANSIASTSTKSVVVPTGSANQAFWGAGLNEGVLSSNEFNNSNTPYSDSAALGTALQFFQAVGTTLTTFAGTWKFSVANDLLTYTQSGGGGPPPPVPLPSPLLLLLSGLGLMGVASVRRAGRSAA